jgi:lysozyme family protein
MGNEGTAFVNNPFDSGGPTKYGITMSSYKSFFGAPVSVSDIENLTPDEAMQLYEYTYWDALSLGLITNAAIAICIFDSSVLYGQKTAAILAQQAVSRLGAVLKFDGVLGDTSIGFLNLAAADQFLAAFHGLVMNRIDNVILANPKDEAFRLGWTNRADRLLQLKDDEFLATLSTYQV